MITRRDAVAALVSTAALPLMSGCMSDSAPAPAATAEADARAALRSQPSDRSAEGQQRVASQTRADREHANAFNMTGLSHGTRTSAEAMRSAYATSLEGFGSHATGI